MTTEETMQKLIDMYLRGMLTAYRDLQSDGPSNELTFDEKFGQIVDREWLDRENRKLTRLLRAAKKGPSMRKKKGSRATRPRRLRPLTPNRPADRRFASIAPKCAGPDAQVASEQVPKSSGIRNELLLHRLELLVPGHRDHPDRHRDHPDQAS
jgi:hypothetical protein